MLYYVFLLLLSLFISFRYFLPFIILIFHFFCLLFYFKLNYHCVELEEWQEWEKNTDERRGRVREEEREEGREKKRKKKRRRRRQTRRNTEERGGGVQEEENEDRGERKRRKKRKKRRRGGGG